MNVITNNKWIGKRTPRPDGADKVTGRAAYAADTTMPGMIWGKVLRSPHPHARIRSIDTSKAEKLPGVKAVVTARDIVDFPIDKGAVMLGIQDMRWMCRNVMARDKALFPGHPIAAVAATTEAIAAEACKLIEVDYEVLPWSIEIDDAILPDAPILHEFNKFDGKPSNIAGRLEIDLDQLAGFRCDRFRGRGDGCYGVAGEQRLVARHHVAAHPAHVLDAQHDSTLLDGEIDDVLCGD